MAFIKDLQGYRMGRLEDKVEKQAKLIKLLQWQLKQKERVC